MIGVGIRQCRVPTGSGVGTLFTEKSLSILRSKSVPVAVTMNHWFLAAIASVLRRFTQPSGSAPFPPHRRLPLGLVIVAIALSLCLTACDIPRVNAEDRLFSNIKLDFLGSYTLPAQTVDGTPVGGLSGLAYDRGQDRFYAVSDDRSDRAPARYYTLKLQLDSEPIKIRDVTVEAVTTLKTADGQPFAKGTIDPEAITLTPEKTAFIASEGDRGKDIAPFLCEFSLSTGQQRQCLPLPKRYLPNPKTEADSTTLPQGIQNNLAFESLTISAGAQGEPFRLFTATESALLQDFDPNVAEQGASNRFLHYLVSETDPPLLVAEHLYPLDFIPFAVINGLTDLQPLDQAGHFLSLERAFGPQGFTVRLFQFTTATATDTATMASFKGNLGGLRPIRKRLLLDLATLGIRLDNLEAMAFGPRLADGSQSLLIMSDDNFSKTQVTQFLLFRLT